MNGPKVPRGTLGFVEKNRFRSTFDENPFYFLVFSHAVQPLRRPLLTAHIKVKMVNAINDPKVLYYVDLRSVPRFHFPFSSFPSSLALEEESEEILRNS